MIIGYAYAKKFARAWLARALAFTLLIGGEFVSVAFWRLSLVLWILLLCLAVVLGLALASVADAPRPNKFAMVLRDAMYTAPVPGAGYVNIAIWLGMVACGWWAHVFLVPACYFTWAIVEHGINDCI